MPKNRTRIKKRTVLQAVALLSLVYIALSVAAPHTAATNANPYHISPIWTLVLVMSLLGLLLIAWLFGALAWMQLRNYSLRLSGGQQGAFRQMAAGVKYLALGLIISTFISGTKPYYASNANLVAISMQLNYAVLTLASFVGFLYLQMGTKYLAASARAAMSWGSRLATIGPPLVLLGAFYMTLAITNTAPVGLALFSGLSGKIILAANIVLVLGSWALGLLAALNIERATHDLEIGERAKPFLRLYNGILLTTCGFIILDALISLGNTRLSTLPLSIVLILIYLFIGVVALGFGIVASSVRKLNAILSSHHKRAS